MRWQQINLAAPEFDRPTEPPSVCGLIYAGKRHLVSGVPEAAKTLLTLIVGMELVRAGGTFALIDFESGPHATRLMLSDLGATVDEIRGVYYVDADAPPDDDDFRALTNAGVTLAVIDAAAGAYGVSGLDDNARRDAETFGRAWIDPLWQAGIATLIVDHVVKNADGRGKFAIGSERKAGRVDVHLGLEVVRPLTRGANGVFRVVTHKDRPGWLPRPRAANLEIVSDPDTHRLSWQFSEPDEDTGDDWRPTVLMERVSQFLQRQTEAVPRSVVEQSVTGKAKYLRQAMDALVTDGFAAETAGGHGSKLLSSARPFTADDQLVPSSSRSSLARNGVPRPSSPPLQGDEDEDELARLVRLAEEYGL